MPMSKLDSIEQLVDRVAQNYTEVVGERNKLRNEIAVKDEEIARAKRDAAAEVEEMRAQVGSHDYERAQFDARLDALHSRLEAILEARVSEVLTSGV